MKKAMIAILCISTASAANAQQAEPNAMMLAQAHDRCMTTVAVRESRTQLDDELIFQSASASCLELQEQLFSAIRTEYPSEQAEQIIPMLEEQAQPNFLRMIRQIRSDREARTSAQ